MQHEATVPLERSPHPRPFGCGLRVTVVLRPRRCHQTRRAARRTSATQRSVIARAVQGAARIAEYTHPGTACKGGLRVLALALVTTRGAQLPRPRTNILRPV